jgi:hypothetical protein
VHNNDFRRGEAVSEDGGFHTARDRTRPELLWFMRNEDVLRRWPVIPEPWAQSIEDRRQAEINPPDRDITYLHGAGR